jgi:hypothetical protein
MKVTCKATKARMSPPHRPKAVYEKESEFDLTLGNEYVVLAMAIWETMILLLLADDCNMPNWHPVELFSVADDHLPDDWFFSTSIANEHGVQAVWGYEHLVRNFSYYEALLERNDDALRLFHQEQARRNEAG